MTEVKWRQESVKYVYVKSGPLKSPSGVLQALSTFRFVQETFANQSSKVNVFMGG